MRKGQQPAYDDEMRKSQQPAHDDDVRKGKGDQHDGCHQQSHVHEENSPVHNLER